MQCLSKLESARRPETAWLEPMEMLATAMPDGAVTRVHCRRPKVPPGPLHRADSRREVLCLQTATRFGDTTTVTRLGELVRVVGGARAGWPHNTRPRWRQATVTAGRRRRVRKSAMRWPRLTPPLRRPSHSGRPTGADPRWARRIGRAPWPAGAAISTPALSDAAAPAEFTGRMREVVMLAGSGLSNREIAERLQLSVRTVEGHLYRAAGRVGARDRNELARAIG